MIWSFPLLRKELGELSAQRRTFAMRATGALVLLGVFMLIDVRSAPLDYDDGSLDFGQLGRGQVLFDDLVLLLHWLILLVMPGMAVGAVSTERKSGTLALLVVTDLGPWELVLQKWLSRVVAGGSLLLASAPLLALTYGLGGLSSGHLAFGFLTLVLSLLQTAAVALAIGCLFRQGTAALVAAYALPLALHWLRKPFSMVSAWNHIPAGWSSFANHPLFGVWRIVDLLPLNTYAAGSDAFTVIDGVMILLSISAALLAARLTILRQVKQAGRSWLLRLFLAIDRRFEAVDAAFGRRRGGAQLPDHHPVAWREFNRRSFSNWHFLVRLVLPLHLVALATLVWPHPLREFAGQMALLLLLFDNAVRAMVLILVVIASGVVASERRDQTLDVLLTTPLSGRDILAQKARSLRRIHLVLGSVPAMVLAWAIFAIWIGDFTRTLRGGGVSFVFFMLGWGAFNILIMPMLLWWLAVWFALRIPNRLRALTWTLGAILLWCAVGVLERFAIDNGWQEGGGIGYDTGFAYQIIRIGQHANVFECCLSPLTAWCALRFGSGLETLERMLVAIVWYGSLAALLRWWCLHSATRLLRGGGAECAATRPVR